jgi:hypothetical protein
LEVTTRPYFKDRTRQHVDINLAHPLDPSKAVRRRIVAPAGMDAAAAVAWGRAEAHKLLRSLCQPVDVLAQKRGEARPDAQPVRQPTKTLAEYWSVFEASHVAELKFSTRVSLRERVGEHPPDPRRSSDRRDRRTGARAGSART